MANNNIALYTTIIANLALQRFKTNLYPIKFIRNDISAAEISANESVKIVVPTKDFVSKDFIAADGIQTQDITSSTIEVKVDKWKDVSFIFNDKEMLEINVTNLIEQKFADAFEAHALAVNNDFYKLYKKVYQVSGTGTANEFKAQDIQNAKKRLSKAKVSKGLSTLVNTDAFYDVVGEATKYANIGTVSAGAYVNATLPAVAGAPLYEDQNLNDIYHTAGTASAGAVTVVADVAAGQTSVALNTAGATDTLLEGDLVNISGEQYVVAADAVATANVINVTLSPALVKAVVADEAVVVAESHAVNLMFAPSFAVFVMRALSDASAILGMTDTAVIGKTIVDPDSGMPIRYALKRDFDHKSWKFSMDILYSITLLDARYACRILNS